MKKYKWNNYWSTWPGNYDYGWTYWKYHDLWSKRIKKGNWRKDSMSCKQWNPIKELIMQTKWDIIHINHIKSIPKIKLLMKD